MLRLILACVIFIASCSAECPSNSPWELSSLALAPGGAGEAFAWASGAMFPSGASSSAEQASCRADGFTVQVRFFSDEYLSLIGDGNGNEGSGCWTAVDGLWTYNCGVNDLNAGDWSLQGPYMGTTGCDNVDCYDQVCAQARADDSNDPDWTKVGCLP